MADTIVGTINYISRIDSSKLKDDAKNVEQTAKQAGEGIEKGLGAKLNIIGGSIKNVGEALTKTLTPAAGIAAVTFRKAFQDYDRGADALITKTGASGDALKGLEGVMKTVAGKVTQSVGEVGETVGELNTRLGLTGKPLEVMTKKMLDLARVSGVDVATATQDVTRLFGDWGVKTEDQVKTMDKLFKTTQVTGIGLDRLTKLMVAFGAPMRELGFSMSDTAALLGKFEKEGVNVDLVIGGLKKALGLLAKAGEDPRKVIMGLEKDISEAGLAAAEKQKVFEIFGTKAGIDMGKAMEEGRFKFNDYVEAINNSEGSIDDAAQRTLDFSDKIKMLANQITTLLGPIGDIGSYVAGGLAAIGPALMGFGAILQSGAFEFVATWSGAFVKVVAKSLWWMVQGTAHIITYVAKHAWAALEVAAKWALTFLLMVAKGTIWLAAQLAQIAAVVAGHVGAAIAVAAAWIAANAVMLLGIGLIIAAVVGLTVIIVKNWDEIKMAISAVWEWIKNNWPLLLAIITGPIGLAILIIVKNFDKIKEAIGNVIQWFKELPGRISTAIGNVGKVLYDKGKDLIQGLIDGAGSLLKDIGKFFLDKVPDFIKGAFKKALGISSPSKVFAGYGKNIVHGLSIGIMGNMGALGKAMDALAGGVAFGASPNVNTMDIKAGDSGLVGTKIIQNNNIYNQIDMDANLRDLAWRLGN